MLLDIRNNELLFTRIEKVAQFRNELLMIKDSQLKPLKFREYKNSFYISLADLEVVRKHISPKYRDQINLSGRYQSFAENFILYKGPLVIKWEPATCTIRGRGLPWSELISLTSYFNKGAKNNRQYGKSWSGMEHLFDPIAGTFPSGLLERILFMLGKNNLPYELNQTFQYPKPTFKLNPVFSFEPTEDQMKCVESLDKSNTGIAKCPTGFGKTSYVAASLIARKGVKSLFLANQKVLIDDAMDDFKSVFKNDDVKIGMIGDGNFEPGDITVASIQSIASALKPPTDKEFKIARLELNLAEDRVKFAETEEQIFTSKKDLKKAKSKLASLERKLARNKMVIPFLKDVQLFIVDESQVLGTNQWNTFLLACPAPYRYTLSATDTRTDGGRIQIIAATGERRFESSAGEQIEKGRLSEFIGNFGKFDHGMDKKLTREIDMNHHQAYEAFIVFNDKRNEHLCQQVMKWAMGNSVLALVTRREHGNIVKQMLEDMGMPEGTVEFVHGETPKKARKELIQNFRDGKFPVLIGTSIFDVGFNAKNASKMVRFNAGASEVREPQRAGRTVRVRDDGSIGETYDLIDINCPFFERQGWERYKVLKEEFGEERVRLNPILIKGTLNVVALKEIVAAAPAETDRERGEEIIHLLQYGTPDEINAFTDVSEDMDTDEADLQMLMEQLSMED